MRASLRVVLFVVVAGGALPSLLAAGQAAAPRPIVKSEQGFSLAVPAEWTVLAEPDAAAAIARADNRQVKAMVFVRREPQAATVTDMLAKALIAIKSRPGQTLVSSSFDVYLERAALFAVYEDATTRYRFVMVPRDFEERSQVYYAITIAAPKAAFPKLTAGFDRVFAAFAILDEAQRATPARATPAAPATRAGSSSPPPKGFDRAAAIERMLSPLKRSRN